MGNTGIKRFISDGESQQDCLVASQKLLAVEWTSLSAFLRMTKVPNIASADRKQYKILRITLISPESASHLPSEHPSEKTKVILRFLKLLYRILLELSS